MEISEYLNQVQIEIDSVYRKILHVILRQYQQASDNI